MAKKNNQTVSVSPEEFVKAWQSSTSIDEVAAKTHMKPFSVVARASRYRKLGVKLKQFERTGRRRSLDIAALNELCEVAKTDQQPRGTSLGQHTTIFGYSVSAFVRWMGTKNYTNEEARKVLTEFGVEAAEGTITTKLWDGRTHKKGVKVAPVTSEEEQQIVRIIGKR